MCRDFIRSLAPTLVTLDACWNRTDYKLVNAEIAALLWWIDCQLPFDQFDNPLFQQFVRSIKGNVDQLSSSTTIVRTLLPLLYQYVVGQ